MATMQPDLEKTIKELYAVFNSHDLDRFISLHTDDASSESVPTGVITRGKEELRAGLERVFAAIPDIKLEVTSYFGSGDRVCEEYVMTATHTGDLMGIPATGKRLSVRGVYVRELREGKTCRVTQYTDYATIMRQLGVLP